MVIEMVKIEHNVVITRLIEEVFTFLANPSNNALWQEGIVESEQISGGVVGVGTRGKDVRKLFGRQFQSTYEIVEYQPNQKIRFKSTSGPIRFEGTYIFEIVPQGTKFTFAIEGDAGPLSGVVGPLAAVLAKKRVEADSNRLKKLLES